MRHSPVIALAALMQIFVGANAFGWGETGHNVIGRVAAKVLVDDKSLVVDAASAPAIATFSSAMAGRYMQMGHLANIPDIHWKSLENGEDEDAGLLGDASHFFDSDMFIDASGNYQISLDYEEAKKQFFVLQPAGNFFQNGTLPWRAQQLYNLYVWHLKQYPQAACSTLTALPNHPTRTALSFAGIMTHFTGDISQPYHAAVDYNGVAASQKGIHSYFESTIVDALEFGLDTKVYARAKTLLNGGDHMMHSVAYFERRAHEMFGGYKPESDIIALTMSVSSDSLYHRNETEKLDAKYAIATAAEAWTLPNCMNLTLAKDLKIKFDAATTAQEKDALAHTKVFSGPNAAGAMENACRRTVETLVDRQGDLSTRGRPLKDYFANLIVERLAIGAAITAHIWNKGWQDGGKPQLCSTYQYALKPSFISPTDPNCAGYALQESATDFLKDDGTSALPWKHSAPSMDQCVSF